MDIVITGEAGTNCHEVSKHVANRLMLNLISPHNYFGKNCYTGEGKLLRDVRLHKDSLLTDKIDEMLKEECNATEHDYVLSSYNAIFLKPDAIRILLTSDIVYDVRNVEYAKYRQEDTTRAFRGAFNRDNYEIVVNVTGMPAEDVADLLISILQSGKFDYYLPLHILLPATMDVEESNKDSYAKIYTFGCCRFIAQSSMGLVHRNIMSGKKFVRATEIPVVNFRLLDMIDYDSYFSRVGHDYMNKTLNYLRLAYYCDMYGYTNMERTFCDLCSLGDPYKKMRAEGINF